MRKGHNWGKKEMDDNGEISIPQTIIASWPTGRLTTAMPTLVPIVATNIVASGLTEDAQDFNTTAHIHNEIIHVISDVKCHQKWPKNCWYNLCYFYIIVPFQGTEFGSQFSHFDGEGVDIRQNYLRNDQNQNCHWKYTFGTNWENWHLESVFLCAPGLGVWSNWPSALNVLLWRWGPKSTLLKIKKNKVFFAASVSSYLPI